MRFAQGHHFAPLHLPPYISPSAKTFRLTPWPITCLVAQLTTLINTVTQLYDIGQAGYK